MAYRRPAVTVTQEFVNLAPALAAFNLPSVIIGQAFQLYTNDNLGTYTGSSEDLAWASLVGGQIVDLAEPDPAELFPITKSNIAVSISAAVLQIVASAATTDAPSDSLTFNDTSPSTAFQDVLAGDKLVIAGGSNAGTYVVRAKVSNTQLTLQSPLPDTSNSSMTYSITRQLANPIVLVRDTDYTAAADAISLEAGIMSGGFDVIGGTVLASYRALRNDLAADVQEFADLTAVTNFFGTSQIGPANPLSYGLQIALQNTVTPVNGLGLNEFGLSDDVLAYSAALDVIKTTTMYMLCPLTQNPAIAPIFKTFVDGESAPEKSRWRACVVNRQLQTIQTYVDDATTVLTTSGSRIIVNTQTDGAVTSPALSTLTDTVPSNVFANVQLGDTVVVTGGTNAIAGEYTVITHTSNTVLVLSAPFATGSSTDIDYYIVRHDGISANGTNLYDRNQTFLTDGVAPGYFVQVDSGTYKGRYAIASVLSEHEVSLTAAIPGITSLVTAVNYDINRDLSKDEQATFLNGYSASIGDRRMVNIWPDILQAPISNVTQDVPGFYGGCALAGMTTGLPTQQGFTNLTMSGFLGLKHSSKYFNDDQLDVIADGGTMILAQDGPEQALYIRHQLTTDRSSIKFQEFSLTKNVDYASFFAKGQYQKFIGPYNVIETTLDDLKTTGKGVLTFLTENRLPRIGGVIKSGSIKSLAEDPVEIDTVNIVFSMDFPIPLNNVDITIQA